MNYTPTDFRTALELDMAQREMLERELGQRLGVSQQSISKWKARNFPPLYRVKDLIEVFGPDSHIARLDLPNMLARTPRLRIAAHGTEPEQVQRASKFPPAAHVAALQQLAPINLTSALPDGLQRYLNGAGPSLSGKPLKTEYNSGLVCAYIKPGVRMSRVGCTGILTLAAAKAENTDGRSYVMAFVLEAGVSLEEVLHPDMLACAKALSVEVWGCKDTTELAARLSEKEYGSTFHSEGVEFDSMHDLL